MLTLGAILAGFSFVAFGLFHIKGHAQMVGYIGATLPVSPGIATLLNYGTTAYLLISGLLLISQQAAGAYLGAAYLVAVSALFHLPKDAEDQDNVQAVLKHLGWAGALLVAASAL